MRSDLLNLVELQARELELGRVLADLASLPDEREALAARVREATERLATAEADLEDSQKERRRLEAELEDAELRVGKYEEQQLQVKTNEQLWAIQEEIKQARAVVSELEDGILRQMERADELGGAIEERGGELERAEADAGIAQAELDRRERALEGERHQVEAMIVELGSQIDPALLDIYGRVKEVRDGVAVAEALSETCIACNFRLRPQLYLEVRNMERVEQCDNCQRILFSREALDLPASVDPSLLDAAATR